MRPLLIRRDPSDMERPRTTTNLQASTASNTTQKTRQEALPSEQIHIRSYDHHWAYDLDVVVVTEDGDLVFHDHYYLQPGHTESVAEGIPAGDYEVRVTLDNSYRETVQCRLDTSPEHTALIEVGNGVLSLTEGLHA